MDDAQALETAIALEHSIATVVGLLIVAMAVAIVVRRYRLPYTVVLVVVGIALALAGEVPGLRGLKLEGEVYAAVCYNLLLPILLFEAALNLKWELFARNARPIFGLAIAGTVVNIGVVGLLVHVFLGVGWFQALILGAIISPTDPLSVVVTFRQLGVPRRLSLIVEGESLFNDAVGLVIFSVLLSAATSGSDFSVLNGVYEFFIVSAGGVVVGGVLGLVASNITRAVDDHLIEVTLSTILAFGSFLLAEYLHIGTVHFSGVIAVVVAGLMMGNHGRPAGMSATTVVALDTFWEYLAFVANSLIFLLIGIELSVLEFGRQLLPILGVIGAVYLIVLFARAFVSYAGSAALDTRDRPIPEKWRHVIFWGGLKGALSMVMVLQVTQPELRLWHGFDLLLSATFGVVFLSLVVQGLSIGSLVKWLRLAGRSEAVERYEDLAARVIAARAGVSELDRLRDSHVLTTRVYGELVDPYREQIVEAEAALDRLHLDSPKLTDVQLRDAMRQAHHAEKSAVLDAFHRGVITEGAFHRMVSDLDERHHAIEAEHEKLDDDET